VVIQFVDLPERTTEVLPTLRKMAGSRLMTLQQSKRLANPSITHKFGLLVHDRFDFVRGVEGDVHGAWARASRRSVSMSL
jgi:hypothetical protein